MLPKNLGAKFHKCDFQIHTPRDAAWKGPFDPISGRADFANALVADCRKKGLHAIAITDHHDLCLQKEVKLAAARELNSESEQYSVEEQLIVFPGIELTLSTPACQVLLIFDPSVSDSTLDQMWGALRLATTPESSPKTTTTHALHTDLSLGVISDALGTIRTNPEETNPAKFETLAEKFILLPNVKKKGHQTILRDGFQSHYKAMPCVGGYIEGCHYGELTHGNRALVEGKQLEWGNRPLGVFQTSDCREAMVVNSSGTNCVEFKNLGNWTTWVKWAEPSAEALRQACLAKSSRISHVEPIFPLLQIVGVTVSNSTFLGTVELGLSPQFNAFIGGRGTGKSSLLEYIRWALCDDPLPTSDESTELPNFQQRRQSLIEGTLRPAEGKVSVFYKKNNIIYHIERTIASKKDSIFVTGPNGNKEPRTQHQIRSEFPIVSYAQKQLSCVGTLPEEINRLIIAPVSNQIAEIQSKIDEDILPKLKTIRRLQIRLEFVRSQIVETEIIIQDRKEQMHGLQSQLHKLSPEQEIIVQSHEGLSQQHRWITKTTEIPLNIALFLEHAEAQIKAIGQVTKSRQMPDDNRLNTIADSVNELSKKICNHISLLIADIQTGAWLGTSGKSDIEDLEKEFVAHCIEYDACITANAKNQTELDEIQSLNKTVSELEVKLDNLRVEKVELESSLDQEGDIHWQFFLSFLDERATLLRTQCEAINAQALHEFRAEVGFCRNHQPIINAMDALISGKNVRDSEYKVANIANDVSSASHPVIRWGEIMNELDRLMAGKTSGELHNMPIFKAAGFTDANLLSIRTGLSSEILEQIRYHNLDDQIVFNFRIGKNADGSSKYIPFNSASPGQQATCLLRTLLGQSGAPLLIDQPEEDLDNEQIQILSERIAETKHNRQLLFVSHNANIVVNGDAELVVAFGYNDPDDNSQGKITQAGSIDCLPIRNRITAVMEGGRDAFNLRKNKYGF
jgi:chromosome segregation protein